MYVNSAQLHCINYVYSTILFRDHAYICMHTYIAADRSAADLISAHGLMHMLCKYEVIYNCGYKLSEGIG